MSGAIPRPGEPIRDDWVRRPLPSNLELAPTAHLESAFSFLAFASERKPGLIMDENAGVYDFGTFVVGPRGRITVGAFSCINAAYIVCEEEVVIGSHCLLGWGSVITDSWPSASASVDRRREVLREASQHPSRWRNSGARPERVVLEDNVWVGFDSIIGPGVRLGRGCVVGTRTYIHADVPPYAVVAGSPARIVRRLDPTDTHEARSQALGLLA